MPILLANQNETQTAHLWVKWGKLAKVAGIEEAKLADDEMRYRRGNVSKQCYYFDTSVLYSGMARAIIKCINSKPRQANR
jgi:hypothetical protein